MNLSGRRPLPKIFFIFIFAICCFCTPSLCQTRDSIVLYNGETLIGAVQGSNLGSVSIDDIDLKMLNIKLYKIKTLIIHERFKIETIEKQIFYGTLRTSERDGWVDIHLDDGKIIPIHITKIYLLTSLDTDILKRLMGMYLRDSVLQNPVRSGRLILVHLYNLPRGYLITSCQCPASDL